MVVLEHHRPLADCTDRKLGHKRHLQSVERVVWHLQLVGGYICARDREVGVEVINIILIKEKERKRKRNEKEEIKETKKKTKRKQWRD